MFKVLMMLLGLMVVLINVQGQGVVKDAKPAPPAITTAVDVSRTIEDRRGEPAFNSSGITNLTSRVSDSAGVNVDKSSRNVLDDVQPADVARGQFVTMNVSNASGELSVTNSFFSKAQKHAMVLAFCSMVSLVAFVAFLKEILGGRRRHS